MKGKTKKKLPKNKKALPKKKAVNLYLKFFKFNIKSLRKFIKKKGSVYSITKVQYTAFICAFLLGILMAVFSPGKIFQDVKSERTKNAYWFDLHRKSQVELLYFGVPGDRENSKVVKAFRVKTGMPERPTPLPQLFNREYWVVTKKYETFDNEETAPYFIELDIPYTQDYPFGPTPYLECNGQCNWIVPGPFGLHGINGDLERLDFNNPGSSGCIRHTDEDISYLYNFLDLNKEIRYYVQDI